MTVLDAQQTLTILDSHSSRKLWDMLADEANPAVNAELANAIYDELYRRGDFSPRGWSVPPV